MSIYNYVMDRFKARAIMQRDVARESGVPFSTVTKIAQGRNKNPSVHTVQKLFEYFKSKETGG